MSELKPDVPPEGGESSPSDFDRIKTGIVGILESEVVPDGNFRSQCYDGEIARQEGITKWVGFRDGEPTDPLYVVQEEVAEDGLVYYVMRFVGWGIEGAWGVHLQRNDFGQLYLTRSCTLVMRDPKPGDVAMLTTDLPGKFQRAQAAGRVEYPLRAVNTVFASILGTS